MHKSGAIVGAPRWAKVFGAIALAVVLLVAILLLTGGGDHGPSRHSPPAALHPQP